MLAHKELLAALFYDPSTGVFTRRTAVCNQAVGVIAGSIGGKGYRYIRVNRKTYRANRLAWFYMSGEWPRGVVDHADGDKQNDRWVNLRDATLAQNGANARTRADNKTGFKGLRRMGRRWQVRIGNGGAIHVGTFDTIEEAAGAYETAALKHYGQFARIK